MTINITVTEPSSSITLHQDSTSSKKQQIFMFVIKAKTKTNEYRITKIKIKLKHNTKKKEKTGIQNMSLLNRNPKFLVTMMVSILLLQLLVTTFCMAIGHDTGSTDDDDTLMGVHRPSKPTVDNEMNMKASTTVYTDAIKKRITDILPPKNIPPKNSTPKKCGQSKICKLDQYCCNPSCGICAPKNGFCTTQVCNPSQYIPTPKSSPQRPQRQRQLRTSGSSPLPPTPTIPATVLVPQFDKIDTKTHISKGKGNKNEVKSRNENKGKLPTAPVQCTCDNDCTKGMQCHTTSKTCQVVSRPIPIGVNKKCKCDTECPHSMQCHTSSSTCRLLNRSPQPCGKNQIKK